MSNTLQKNATAWLDGVRGMAAFGVFLNHFSLAFYSAWQSQKLSASHLGGLEIRYAHSWFSFLNNGGYFVAIFFVLSGFVLSRKYLHTNKLEVVVSGLHRRFLRLYVPIAFTLILSFILMVSHNYYNVSASHITHSEWFSRQWTFAHPLRRLWASLTYGTMFYGDASFNTCLWTISTEFYGSLFVYAFLAFTHFTGRYRLLMLFLVMWYFYVTGSPFYLAFMLGISLCYTERWLRAHSAPLLMSLASLVLITTSLTLASIPFSGPFPGTWQHTFKTTVWNYTPWCLTVAAYCLVLAFLLLPALQRLLGMRLFRFMGYISFSLYLLHPLLLGSFGAWLMLHLHSSMAYNTATLIVFMATIALLIPASWLMTRYVDQAGITLARRVYEFTVCTRKQPAAEEPETSKV